MSEEIIDAPERLQHCIDPVTGQKKAITVRSIKHKIKLGKGGALAGAVNQAVSAKTLKSGKPKAE